MPKVVFSKTLARVDWNSELVRGDALEEVARLKRQPGKSMSVGGSALATSLARGGLIDEFRFYVMPTIVGCRDAHLPHAEQTYRSHPRRGPAVHVGGGSPQVPPHRSDRRRLTACVTCGGAECGLAEGHSLYGFSADSHSFNVPPTKWIYARICTNQS